jgi:hypothetical protein
LKNFAVAKRDPRAFSVAKPGGGLNQSVEHRLQVEGRPADNLQNIAGRGLLFEGLGKLSVGVGERRVFLPELAGG